MGRYNIVGDLVYTYAQNGITICELIICSDGKNDLSHPNRRNLVFKSFKCDQSVNGAQAIPSSSESQLMRYKKGLTHGKLSRSTIDHKVIYFKIHTLSVTSLKACIHLAASSAFGTPICA
jgi:hypothetical protein